MKTYMLLVSLALLVIGLVIHKLHNEINIVGNELTKVEVRMNIDQESIQQ